MSRAWKREWNEKESKKTGNESAKKMRVKRNESEEKIREKRNENQKKRRGVWNEMKVRRKKKCLEKESEKDGNEK